VISQFKKWWGDDQPLRTKGASLVTESERFLVLVPTLVRLSLLRRRISRRVVRPATYPRLEWHCFLHPFWWKTTSTLVCVSRPTWYAFLHY